MEYDIHTLLDLATLATTLWVIYMIRFNLRSSYMEDKDNFAIYYVVSFLPFMPIFLFFKTTVNYICEGTDHIFVMSISHCFLGFICVLYL